MALTTAMMVALGASAASAGAGVYAANKSAQSTNNMINAANANKLDPGTVGANSLNAQAGLANQAIGLNNQYGSQFANSNNMGLFSSLFGQGAANGLTNSQIQGDPNFSKFTPDMQAYLTSQRGSGGGPQVSPSDTGTAGGQSQYEAMLSAYQGMGGKLGTPEDAANFNKWVTDQGFGAWHENNSDPNNPAASLGSITNAASGNTAAPGVLDMIAGADKALNPNYQSSLDALGKAAGVAPGTINYNNVGQSPYGDSLSAFMAGGTAPQVNGPGANQGAQHLTNLLGSSGYQAVQGSQAQGNTGANFAGPAATAAAPQINAPMMAGVQQAQGNTSQGSFSQAPTTINVPGGLEKLVQYSVSGPTGYDKVSAPGGVANVNAPGAVGNVNAQTGFERVSAPNVGLQQVSAGQNQLLQNLQQQGFNANRPIQQTLEQQAQGDLALGGQLSADQTRLAQQASRAAAESRGMAGSNGAMLNEVQRQLDMSRQLQNERRQFASGVEQQGFGQLATQQGQAIQAAGVTNDFLGLGVNAQQANNQNALSQAGMGLQAGLANQAAGLQGNQLNLQGQLANQSTALAQSGQQLQAGMANQNAALQGQQMGLQAGMANQSAGLDLSRLGLQAQMANQQNAFSTGAANQQAGLDFSRMGLQAQTSNAANQLSNNQFNAGQAQQNSQYNAGMLNNLNQFNAGQYNNASQFNAGQANAQAQLMAQLGLQAGQFNAGQLNNMGQFNAGQADSAANRFNQMSQFNAGQNQQANLANQQAFAQNYAQQMQGANSLGNLFNTQAGQAMDAQQANQQAWLNQRGQTMSGLQALMGADNQLGMFNAQQGQNAQQFNAGQQQQGFQNQLAYQQAVAQGRFDPMAALGFANGQQNWGMFNPWNQSIMSMYAGNMQNAANAQIAGANNSAAVNSGLIQGLGGLAGGIINAYGNKGGG